MNPSYTGTVTIIQFDTTVKARWIPWDNNDGKGEVVYNPEPNEDGFFLLKDIPIRLAKLLLGCHPTRYRLYYVDGQKPVVGQKTNPGTGANEIITLYPWRYEKTTYYVNPNDPNDHRKKTDYKWIEVKHSVESNNEVGEITTVTETGPAQITEPETPPEPVEPETENVGEDPFNIVDERGEIEVPPIKRQEAPEAKKEEKPVVSVPMTKKEIIEGHKERCGKLGLSYRQIETRYRESINKPRGFLNKNQFPELCKLVEEEITKASTDAT